LDPLHPSVLSVSARRAFCPLTLHDALPICAHPEVGPRARCGGHGRGAPMALLPRVDRLGPQGPGDGRHPLPVLAALSPSAGPGRSEEHTSELQSRENLVCRLLLEKKKIETK